jgi:hypothetical protein
MTPDTSRQGDFDGGGNLSERALIDFVVWFLRVAIDQVRFMSSLFELDNLTNRLHAFVAQRENLKPEAVRLLDEILVREEIDRGEASRITGLPERSARRGLDDLFPAHSLETLFPRL